MNKKKNGPEQNSVYNNRNKEITFKHWPRDLFHGCPKAVLNNREPRTVLFFLNIFAVCVYNIASVDQTMRARFYTERKYRQSW